jgi:protoheme IX farnesyltransferase
MTREPTTFFGSASSEGASRDASLAASAPPVASHVVRDLFALTKPRITVIVLATCASGMAVAPSPIPGSVALLALLGTALIVASANVLNMWWERDTDGLMARTRQRPLPAGRLPPDVALFFGLALGASSLPMLIAVNRVTALLGAIALALYVLAYTPLKRRSTLALWVGAVPGAMPPLMGWTSATGSLLWADGKIPHGLPGLLGVSPLGGLLLFSLLFAWQLPHFNAIALFRADDYARAGLKVVSVERGAPIAKAQIAGYSLLLVGVSLGLVAARVGGTLFEVSTVALGTIFVALAVYGVRSKAGSLWAKGVFGYSIVYLTVLLAVLVVDRNSF